MRCAQPGMYSTPQGVTQGNFFNGLSDVNGSLYMCVWRARERFLKEYVSFQASYISHKALQQNSRALGRLQDTAWLLWCTHTQQTDTHTTVTDRKHMPVLNTHHCHRQRAHPWVVYLGLRHGNHTCVSSGRGRDSEEGGWVFEDPPWHLTRHTRRDTAI